MGRYERITELAEAGFSKGEIDDLEGNVDDEKAIELVKLGYKKDEIVDILADN